MASNSKAETDRIIHSLNLSNEPVMVNRKELPEIAHDAWTNDHQQNQIIMSEASLIPIVNLSDPDAGRLMREACQKWGAFQAIGHGLPMSLLDEVEAETRRLFALPMETKMLAANSGEHAGSSIRYGEPKMSKFYHTRVLSEGFTIRGSLSPAEPVTLLWQEDEAQCNTFCDVMNKYQKEVEMVSKKIVSLLITSLGLTEDDLPWMKPDDHYYMSLQTLPPTALRLNSYPICPDPTQAMGMAPHTDTSIITLLYQGNIGGLQIENEGGEWVNVPPVEGALVVNLGDLMHIFTNGKLKSVMHQVLANGSRHRISVGYFYGPPRDMEVAPARKLVEEEGKAPLYPSVTWEEYMKLKHTHGYKAALEMIQK